MGSINYSHIPIEPGPAAKRDLIITKDRPPTKHNDTKAFLFKGVFPIWLTLVVLGPLRTVLVLLTLLSLTFLSWQTWITLAIVVFSYLYHHASITIENIIHNRINGLNHIVHDRGSIKTRPYYQNYDILFHIWYSSPYRLSLLYSLFTQNKITKEQYNVLYQEFMINNKKLNDYMMSIGDNNNDDNNDDKKQDQKQKTLPILEYSTISRSNQQGINNTTNSNSNNTNNISLPIIDSPHSVIFFQTVEGYCGGATMNTALCSIPHTKLLPFENLPGPISIGNISKQLKEYTKSENLDDDDDNNNNNDAINKANQIHYLNKYIHNNNNNNNNNNDLIIYPFKSIQTYRCDNTDKNMNFQKFRQILLLSNNLNYRLLINFLRGPLFIPSPKTTYERLMSTLGGHWSVVGGVIYDPTSQLFFALILDVNHTYGPWIATFEDLYDACYSRDDSGYRGLVVLEVDERVQEIFTIKDDDCDVVKQKENNNNNNDKNSEYIIEKVKLRNGLVNIKKSHVSSSMIME